jgi:hypothetical protein
MRSSGDVLTYLLCLGTAAKPGARSELGECNLWTTYAHCCSRARPPRVCIDLGLANSGLGRQAAAFRPDILILTHADDDHIGGFGTFASSTLPPPYEVWVPYEWGLVHMALATSLTRPQKGQDPVPPRTGDPVLTPESIQAIESESNADKRPLPSVTVLTEESDSLPHIDGSDPGEQGPSPYRPQQLDPTSAQLRAVAEDVEAVVTRERGETDRLERPAATGTPKAVAREIVKKAKKLSDILSWAEARQVRIRYFSTDAVRDAHTPRPWEWVGIPGIATVVNAIEVHISQALVQRAPEVLYRLVALTSTNRRALVTFLWEGNYPCAAVQGALIWSDSSGETCLVGAVTSEDLVPWPHVRVMTAPHHGSDNSAHGMVWRAWQVERSHRGRALPVVISGGKPSARTATHFTDLSPLDRACTCCRHGGPQGQHKTVTALFIGDGVWIHPHCVGPS